MTCRFCADVNCYFFKMDSENILELCKEHTENLLKNIGYETKIFLKNLSDVKV